MDCSNLPPFQVWLITSWVAVTACILIWTSPQPSIGFNGQTVILGLFFGLLCSAVLIAYKRGRKSVLEGLANSDQSAPMSD